MVSCSRPHSEEKAARIRTDGLGRQVLIPANIKRIISLASSETEMLMALVPDSLVIAVTPNCNYPPALVAGKDRIETYPLDIESVLAHKPDIVFSEEGMIPPEDADRLQKLGINLFVFRFRNSAEVLAAMDSMVAWLPSKPEAKKLTDALHAGLAAAENRIKNSNKNPVKTLAITYIDPIFAYGFDTWMTDKIRLAGGRNVLDVALDKPYPVLQRETVLKLNPDVLLGGSFEKLDTSFFRLYPELKQINAYQHKRIYALTDDLASRPGPRIMEGIKEIEKFINH